MVSMTLLKLLAIAALFAATSIWLYAYTPVETVGLLATVPVALGLNSWVLHSAFAGRFRPVVAWAFSAVLAVTVTLVTMLGYLHFAFNHYPT
jgi:hypothetical protein